MNRLPLLLCLPLLLSAVALQPAANAQDDETGRVADPTEAAENVDEAPDEPNADPPTKPVKNIPGLTRLAEDYDVWIDPMRKYVIADGKVALRRGQLEMFACPKGTKEHESIVAVNSPATWIHAALLAIGAEPGHTVKFDPEYVPASGPRVDVFVLWIDKDGKRHKDRAETWVRNIETGKQMEHHWVFGGSGFWVDEATGQRSYLADGGDLICVSNFPSATLDLNVKSSRDTGSLLFEAFTERIPPRGTHVRLVLIPQIPKKPASDEPKESPTPKAE